MSKVQQESDKAHNSLGFLLTSADIFTHEAEKFKRQGNMVEYRRHMEKARQTLIRVIELTAEIA